jgi:hypothetical protein
LTVSARPPARPPALQPRKSLPAPKPRCRPHLRPTPRLSPPRPPPSPPTPRTGVLLLLAGTDPYYLVDAGVAAAAALSGGAKPRAHKRLPPSLDAFGWCTWDAFYSTVSARGLAEGLSSLHSGGVFPKLLIIDDGWQVGALAAARRCWRRLGGGGCWGAGGTGLGEGPRKAGKFGRRGGGRRI